jgi:surface protein with Ig-like domain
MVTTMKKQVMISLLALASVAIIYTGCKQEEDIAPPIITLQGDNPFYLTLNDDYSEPGFSVTDQEDGTISNDRVSIINNVDKDNTGTYVISYTVVDNSGNTGTAERTVIVSNSADFLAGQYFDSGNACQTVPATTFDAEIRISTTENGKFTITNFGGFGNNVFVECLYLAANNEITAVAGQSLGGSVILESLNIASVTNNASPVEFFVNYNWLDGASGDVCNSTYSQ